MALRILIVLFLLIPVVAMCGEEDFEAVPFFLPTPDGWRTETIVFPMSFAPELKYEGLEELRFAPGMFKESEEDFWTYAFIWWISDDVPVDPFDLETDLEIYFSGLARVVAEEGGFDTGAATYDVQLAAPNSSLHLGIDYVGTAKIFDSFVTRETLYLNIKIRQILCPDEDRQAVIFELSPQPYTHAVWTSLTGIREGFRCGE